MKLLLLSLVFTSLAFASGENGKEIIIQNLNQPQSHNLSGQDGSDGRDGANGSSAYNCGEEAKHGDNGQRGENGEDGGNGGNAIVHISNLSELKNLKIISRGGSGGSGGKGGTGGSPCNGGHYGSDGERGYSGDDGKFGKLYLVKKPAQFERNIKNLSLSISELVKNQAVMIENIWDTQTGAQQLLAPESELANTYYIQNRVFKKTVIIKWLATQDISAFGKIEASLAVDQEIFSLTYKNAIAHQEIVETDKEVIVTIHEMFKESEIISLNAFKAYGMGKEIKFEFMDAGAKTPELNVDYKVSVERYRFLGRDEAFFYNKPAADFISFDGKKVTLHVGQLDFPDKDKKKGSKLYITLKISYQLAGQVKVKVLVLAYRVGYINSKFQLDNSEF